MGVICNFWINVDSKIFDYECFKCQWPNQNHEQNAKPWSATNSVLKSHNQYLKDMDVQTIHLTKTSSYIRIIVKMPKPQSGTSRIFQWSNHNLNVISILFIFKVNIDTQNYLTDLIKPKWIQDLCNWKLIIAKLSLFTICLIDSQKKLESLQFVWLLKGVKLWQSLPLTGNSN